jgi:hypothetical protein
LVWLILALFSIVPLAHASPPDSLWIAGIYDEADFDDVVTTVVSGQASVELFWAPVGRPVVLAVVPSLNDSRLVPSVLQSPLSVRAPPA